MEEIVNEVVSDKDERINCVAKFIYALLVFAILIGTMVGYMVKQESPKNSITVIRADDIGKCDLDEGRCMSTPLRNAAGDLIGIAFEKIGEGDE